MKRTFIKFYIRLRKLEFVAHHFVIITSFVWNVFDLFILKKNI